MLGAAIAAPLLVPGAVNISVQAPQRTIVAGHACLDGQTDDNGIMYLACGNIIKRTTPLGAALPDIPNPFDVPLSDVAPSPNGDYLYVSRGAYRPGRLRREHDGTYRADPSFAPLDFIMWVRYPFQPSGWLLSTDAFGDLYLSNGSFWSGTAVGGTQSSVVKYSPTGAVLTIVGDHGTTDGTFRANQDIEVSRDGSRFYVGENCGKQCLFQEPGYQPSRVQRFDRRADGSYQFTRVITATSGTCTSPGAAHSAYGLATDSASHLYVTSATCGSILEFDQNDAFVGFIAKAVNEDTLPTRTHWLSSDASGRLCLAEWDACIRHTTTPTLPTYPLPTPSGGRPDLIAPVPTFAQVVPATAEAPTRLKVAAVDERGPVTAVQTRVPNGEWGAWHPLPVGELLATIDLATSSEGAGAASVELRVRDAAGNTSSAVTATTVAQEPPVAVAAPLSPATGQPIASPPKPTRDTTLPRLHLVRWQHVRGPASTIRLSVKASDNGLIQRIRIVAPGYAKSGRWQPFTSTLKMRVSRLPQHGLRLSVQVRDDAGNTSSTTAVRVRRRT